MLILLVMETSMRYESDIEWADGCCNFMFVRTSSFDGTREDLPSMLVKLLIV